MTPRPVTKLTPEEISDVLAHIGSADVIADRLRRFSADVQYFHSNYSTLRKDYPDQWVAILDKTVVGHGKDLELVLEEMRADGIDTGKAYLQRTYFKEKPPAFILQAA